MNDFWHWPNFFNLEDRKEINNFIDNNFDYFEDKKHGATNNRGEFKKKSTVKIITYEKIKHLKKIKKLFEGIDFANKRNFNFDLYPPSDLDIFLHNTYSSDNLGEYDFHVDTSRSPFYDIKFTLLINLSVEDYTGGDFCIFNGDLITFEDFKSGSAFIFRSYLSHKVTPVIKGERKTLAYFFHGPKFK